MIVSTDPDYLDTKLVKQGFKELNPIFQELAIWIHQKYDTKPLNIYYDKIEDNRPRLNIIFEFYNNTEKFKDERGNFDTTKQHAVSKKFKQILEEGIKVRKGFFSRLFKKPDIIQFNQVDRDLYDTEDLLVIFDAFEPVARQEINKNVPQKEIENLEQELKSKDIWKIYREFETTTFFFYTDDQIQKYALDGTTDIIKNSYFELLKKYDEFSYLTHDKKVVEFDSKENFEKTYEGNWFYYYKR